MQKGLSSLGTSETPGTGFCTLWVGSASIARSDGFGDDEATASRCERAVPESIALGGAALTNFPREDRPPLLSSGRPRGSDAGGLDAYRVGASAPFPTLLAGQWKAQVSRGPQRLSSSREE